MANRTYWLIVKNWKILAALCPRVSKAVRRVLFTFHPWLRFSRPFFQVRKPLARRLRNVRFLRVEYLEPRCVLSGGHITSLAQDLINMTPNPGPSGDQPPAGTQEILDTNFTANPPLPDPGISADITSYLAGVALIATSIESNPAARPGFWGEAVAGSPNQYRIHLDDNGMLISRWVIDFGDGTGPQTFSPQPWVIHQYPTGGQFTISVTAYSPSGVFTAEASTGGFSDLVGIGGSGSGVQMTVVPQPPTIHVGGPQTVALGQTFALDNLAAFSDPNPDDSFAYAIGWGDGSPVFLGSNFDVISSGGNGLPFLGALTSTAGDGPLTHVYSNVSVRDKHF
jgi:PKD domain-containing protein